MKQLTWSTLETDVYVRRYTLLVMLARNEEEDYDTAFR